MVGFGLALVLRHRIVLKDFALENPDLDAARAIGGVGGRDAGVDVGAGVDIGAFDGDGYLRIVDRKKELIVNSGGKNISPANVENCVRSQCPLIGSVVAIGDGRPFLVALVTLDPDAAAALAARLGIEPNPSVLAVHPEVVETVDRGIEAANAKLSRVEQLKYVEILPEYWPIGGDELTPTAKLKRKAISEKYAEVIDQIYVQARRS